MVANGESLLAVKCKNVTKQFPQGNGFVRALRGIDLDVAVGQITLIVGPSGCGKTTLLSVISGILRANGGDILLFGNSIVELSDSAMAIRRRHEIGIVFQQFNLLPGFTAVENAALPLILSGCSRRQALKRSCLWLERMRVADHDMALPSQLSSGQQQRVAIARGLVSEPRLLICDEPTSALDTDTGRAIMLLLRQVAEQHDRAVLVVTHDTRLYEHAHRIAHMEDGRIVSMDTRR